MPTAALIDWLQPDLDGLLKIVGYWQKHPSGDNLSVALQRYAVVCEREAAVRPGQKAVDAWIRAADAYRNLGRYGEAIRCLRAADGCNPLCFDVRLLLGSCLLESKDYGEAVANLKWCVQQNPRNKTAQRELERAVDGQLRFAAAKTTPENR
jgi:tetratricopeptide (TPR) repeat protein